MKIVTRKGLFETNSSSTHSIVITGGSYVPTLWKPTGGPGGTLEVYSGEFGWEVETYRDPQTKASYCLTFAKHNAGENNLLAMLEKVLKENTGAGVVQWVNENAGGYSEWGYIDHQSSDVCEDAYKSEETLRDFIFNYKSLLLTDNDNH